jgi:hypothetical protein
MSVLSDLFNWINDHLLVPSPLKKIKPKPKVKKTTIQGRVVYERKRHDFNMRDVIRIWIRIHTGESATVGGTIAAIVQTDLMLFAWMILRFPKKELLIWRWYGDYIKGILDGVRELLSQSGWSMDEVSLTTSGETVIEEGSLV